MMPRRLPLQEVGGKTTPTMPDRTETPESIREKIGDTEFVLCFVKGNMDGEPFMMGDEKGNLWDACSPVHEVRVSDFYMSRHPVTQALWREVALADVAGFKKKLNPDPSFFFGDTRPVEQVSWDDAQLFIEKLNLLTAATRPAGYENHAYRLPTEAEWEYAARGGQKGRGHLYAGSDKLKEASWYDANSHSETKPVCLLAPNELGLYDMGGNVWEWVNDRFSSDYYPKCAAAGIVENPRGADSGTGRVLRGGGWYNGPHLCCASFRLFVRPDSHYFYLGFRLAFCPAVNGGHAAPLL